LNEVGGDPSRFGATPEEFHRVMDEAARERPRTMLATSTHDSKRSEDVRARLAAISEIPEVWIETIRRWSEMNKKYRNNGAPGQNMEYLIYQNLAGAWPIDETRLSAYVEKAAREAKTHTSWLCRDESYEEGLRNFIRHICMDKEFQEDLERFVDMIAGTGRINSLAQVLLKTTVPGIPDFYQGMELWDLSLVDPDNRRPVDYNLRRKSLQEIDGMTAEEILAQEDRGIAKLFVMKRALTLRNRYPHIFSRSGYSPLEIAGDKKNHIIAFLRGDKIATVVPRLVFSLRGAWGNTAVDLPGGSWRNVFTGETITGGAVPAAELFQSFPVALLEKEAQ
jgi:(1->4)-alpha-D-glucan 1-alpha-D-glucosylmutase